MVDKIVFEGANYLNRILEYCRMISDHDDMYTVIEALQLFGVILGKKSFINIMPKCKRFNLYAVLVGESYLARKNTVQDIFKEFYPYDLILPNESSAEKFLSNLSKTPNGIWMYGELSKILKHVHTGGYLSTIVETLNDLHNYEAPTYVRDVMKETITINNPYPSFNSTLTPSVLKEQITPEMLEGGFFSKIILVPGESKNTGRGEIPDEAFRLKEEIITFLRSMFNKNFNLQFELSPEALKRFNEIEREAIKDSKVRSVAGRYAEDAVILAGLIAFGEFLEQQYLDYTSNNSNNSINNKNSNNSVNNYNSENILYITIFTIITPSHMDKGWSLIQPCIKLAEELYDYAAMSRKYIVRLRKYVEKNYPVNKSLAERYCNLDSSEAKISEETLVNTHRILKIIQFQSVRKDGVPTKVQSVYCMTNPDGKKCNTCKLRQHCEDANMIEIDEPLRNDFIIE